MEGGQHHMERKWPWFFLQQGAWHSLLKYHFQVSHPWNDMQCLRINYAWGPPHNSMKCQNMEAATIQSILVHALLWTIWQLFVCFLPALCEWLHHAMAIHPYCNRSAHLNSWSPRLWHKLVLSLVSLHAWLRHPAITRQSAVIHHKMHSPSI